MKPFETVSKLSYEAKQNPHPYGWGFLFGEDWIGLERALRKHAGGMFLARGRVLWALDASGRDVDNARTVSEPPLRVAAFFAVDRGLEPI